MENVILWIIVIVVVIFVAWLIWYFWPRNGAEVIVIKNSKSVEIDTPIVEGKPEMSEDYKANETQYPPNKTPTIDQNLKNYAPLDEFGEFSDDDSETYLTPGIGDHE